MNADDSLRAREVAELARMLPVPAERDLPAGRLPTIKEHLMTELRTDQPAAHSAPRAPRRGRTAWTVAAAGLLAAAAAAATVIGLTGQSGGTGTDGKITAATLLRHVANAAAKTPVQEVTDNQFMYIETKHAAGRPYGQPAPSKLDRRQVWTPVADLCRPSLVKNDGVPLRIVRNSSDMAANGLHLKCPYRGTLNDPSYRLLQSLTTDPRALLNHIYKQTAGAGQSPDQEAFTTIGDLLRDSVAPPDVSAALFRAAALIPGVTLVPNAVDAAGRLGVAVSFTFNGEQSEWIFDKQTFQLLGELDFVNGTLTIKSAIINRGFVDHLGQVLPTG
ncbi:MAG TPA: CU044_5270 family protein [Streptosporangiaceae bacterium]